MTTYTICEPYTEGKPYDAHQFARGPRAVSQETHLAFSDMDRMHLGQRSPNGNRQNPIPRWVLDDKSFRQVILCYAEKRSLGNGFRDSFVSEGTDAERLAAARERETDAILRLRFKLQAAQNRYAAAVVAGESQERLLKLAEEVAHHDTEVMAAIRGSYVLAANVAYMSYRCGCNSVQVATQLGIKPSHVRQILNRMNQVWTAISGEYPGSRYAPGGRMHRKPMPGREKTLQLLFVLFAGGKTFGQIAKMMNRKESNVRQDYRRYFSPLHNNPRGERTLRIIYDETGTRVLYTRALPPP